MAQPKIEGTKEGTPVMPYGSDQTHHYQIRVDSDGHIHIDVETSALPSGAAEQATLVACQVALELIDDLRNALGSVDSDDLQVDVKSSPRHITDIQDLGDDIKQAVAAVSVPTATYTAIASFTVTTGKTAYILGYTVGSIDNTTEFEIRVRAAGADKVRTGGCGNTQSAYPPVLFKATAGQLVDILIAHYEGANRWVFGTLFYVEY